MWRWQNGTGLGRYVRGTRGWRGQGQGHELRSNGEIMFTIWVDEHPFGVSAEGLPRDHKTNLERAVRVGRSLVRNKGLLENI